MIVSCGMESHEEQNWIFFENSLHTGCDSTNTSFLYFYCIVCTPCNATLDISLETQLQLNKYHLRLNYGKYHLRLNYSKYHLRLN